MYDVIIVGGGPAGLSAALVLSRSNKKVVIIDSGLQRNRFSKSINSFITRDGASPASFLLAARDEISKYRVQFYEDEVVSASIEEKGFEVKTAGKKTLFAKKILIATGLIDELPNIPAVEQYYGKSIFHCPYCDGWELRNQPIIAYGKGKNAMGLALLLKGWSEDISIINSAPPRFSSTSKNVLAKNNIKIYEDSIIKIEGKKGKMECLILAKAGKIRCSAIFFAGSPRQHSRIPALLNCRFIKKGSVVATNKKQETNIPGLYVAGDAAKDMQMVIAAAAEGAKAGVAINTALQMEALK